MAQPGTGRAGSPRPGCPRARRGGGPPPPAPPPSAGRGRGSVARSPVPVARASVRSLWRPAGPPAARGPSFPPARGPARHRRFGRRPGPSSGGDASFRGLRPRPPLGIRSGGRRKTARPRSAPAASAGPGRCLGACAEAGPRPGRGEGPIRSHRRPRRRQGRPRRPKGLPRPLQGLQRPSSGLQRPSLRQPSRQRHRHRHRRPLTAAARPRFTRPTWAGPCR
jgi:hypothetical protein